MLRRQLHLPLRISRRRLSHINWHESTIITDRKSKFQARHTTLTDPNDIPEILEQLLSDKTIAKASHPHIIAWRTGSPSQITQEVAPKKKKQRVETEKKVVYSNIQQGFKDNGEKSAGSKLLDQVLVHNNLMNVLVIVTRWYGGNPIGSSRFRHIINSAFDSLRKAGKI